MEENEKSGYFVLKLLRIPLNFFFNYQRRTKIINLKNISCFYYYPRTSKTKILQMSFKQHNNYPL